jgi:hypothetical protein
MAALYCAPCFGCILSTNRQSPIINRQSAISNPAPVFGYAESGAKPLTLLWCAHTAECQALSGGLNTLDHKMLGIILIPLESSPAQAALSAFSPSPVGISGPTLIDDFMLE